MSGCVKCKGERLSDLRGIRRKPEFSVIPKGKALQAAALLIVAFAFGGGGSGTGLANLVVQLAALALLAFNLQAVGDFFRQAPRFPTILIGAALVLPLLQSVPLPPVIWQNLPGRDLVARSLELVDRQDDWFPMSLEVRRTLLAFLSLLPPLTILVLAWKLPPAQKRHLLLLVAAAGVFMVLLGTQQLATGNRRLVLFAEAFGTSDLQGTFANRNSAGLFLDIALCALIGAFPRSEAGVKWLAGGGAAAVLLLIGIVLTRSRSSMTLAMVPFLFFAFRLYQAKIFAKLSWRVMAPAALGILVLGGGIVALSAENQRVQRSLSRFEGVGDPEDRRLLIWEDTLGSIKRFWPLGSGIGTFDEVFQIDETLENLRQSRAARAHNDYLETSLESGIVGIALLAGWMVFLFMQSIRAMRIGDLFATPVAVLALFTFQSVLDYPLRNQTLLCLAGLMLAILIDASSFGQGTRQQGRTGSASHKTGSNVLQA